MRRLLLLLICAIAPWFGAPRAEAQTSPSMFDGVAAKVVSGLDHSCLLDSSSQVRCWGRDDYGQLGLGAATGLQTVPALTSVGGVVDLAAGARHTCALLSAGTVKCWGRNNAGQLGNASNSGSETPNPTPLDVTGLTDVVAIAAGGEHSCALMADATVRCWGSNSGGQLGRAANAGTGTPNPTPLAVSGIADALELAAGGSHSCILTATGAGKCWGRNVSGQLGNGSTGVAVQATPVDVSGLTGAHSLTLGANHSCVLTSAGSAKCWGEVGFGQLGSGGGDNSMPADVVGLAGATSITAGSRHTCATLASGGAKCWGANNQGQLGNPLLAGEIFAVLPLPVEVVGLAQAVSVTAGDSHSCAITRFGGVLCWGTNNQGQQGADAFFPWRVAPAPVVEAAAGVLRATRTYTVDGNPVTQPVQTIAAGRSTTCTLTAARTPLCWGRNDFGQVGNGTTTNAWSPVRLSGLRSNVAELAAGQFHTCALAGDGTVYCWGVNHQGQLGIDTAFGTRNAPNQVPGLTGMTAITAGDQHTCALSGTGEVWCWGDDLHGQLGDGGSSVSSFTPRLVSGVTGVVAIDAGSKHTCALTSFGETFCWGDNVRSQLGDGSTTTRAAAVAAVAFYNNVIAISAGGLHTCVLYADATASCIGDNSGGQLGNGTFLQGSTAQAVTNLSGIVHLAAGLEHTCAVTSSGAMWCWGDNAHDQLGDPDIVRSNVPVAIAGPGSGMLRTAAGWQHSCALSAAGTLGCWGRNEFGELGRGNLAPVGRPAWILSGQTLDFSPPASLPAGQFVLLSAAVSGDSGQPGRFERWPATRCALAGLQQNALYATNVGLCAVKSLVWAGIGSSGTFVPPPQQSRLLRIVRGQPTLAVTSSENPSPPPSARTLVLTATLGAAASTSANVSFCANAVTTNAGCSGGTLLCTVPANSSPIRCDVTSLPTGTHAITAYFAGDANHFPATSAALTQEVYAGVAPTFTSPDSVTFTIGTPATFSVTTTGAPTPTLTYEPYENWPAGLSFSLPGDGTLVFAGVPGAGDAGTYEMHLHATNGVAPAAEQVLQIVVKKRVPTIVWAAPEPIVVGTALDATQLLAVAMDGNAPIAGTLDYSPPAGTLLDTGPGQVLSVTFTPQDGATYDSVTQTTTIDVLRKTPAIDWPAPAAIETGTPLGAAQLNATARDGIDPVAGTFVYTPPAGTLLEAGTAQTLSVVFTPADEARYETAHASTTIDVTAPTVADLQIANDVDPAAARIGNSVRYVLIATNAGPAAVAAARVRDVPPTRLASVLWECIEVVNSGANCPEPGAGSGTLDVAVDLPPGAFLRFELFGTVQPAATGDSFVAFDNSATLALPAGSPLTDPNPSNNSATASVLVVPEGIFVDGFEASGASLSVPAAERARGRRE